MDLTEKLQLAYEKIKEARRILIIGHTSPDADALSSMGAMIEIAGFFGLEVKAYAEKKSQESYVFIPNENLIFSEKPGNLLDFDLILILDCGSIARTGLEERLRSLLSARQEEKITRWPYIMEFDHHQASESYADLEIRLADKASTTEIIYQFLKVNGLEINKTLADCILIGLMTDTGHFLHANSSREAIAVSSEMLLRGASLPEIIKGTTRNKSFLSLKIWGRALENMRFEADTGLVSSALTARELAEFLAPADSEIDADLFSDIVSFLSRLNGARVALFLREEDDKVKGSLRTNFDDIDVARIAQNWGGGGHKKAAGFSLPGRLVRTERGWKVIS